MATNPTDLYHPNPNDEKQHPHQTRKALFRLTHPRRDSKLSSGIPPDFRPGPEGFFGQPKPSNQYTDDMDFKQTTTECGRLDQYFQENYDMTQEEFDERERLDMLELEQQYYDGVDFETEQQQMLYEQNFDDNNHGNNTIIAETNFNIDNIQNSSTQGQAQLLDDDIDYRSSHIQNFRNSNRSEEPELKRLPISNDAANQNLDQSRYQTHNNNINFPDNPEYSDSGFSTVPSSTRQFYRNSKRKRKNRDNNNHNNQNSENRLISFSELDNQRRESIIYRHDDPNKEGNSRALKSPLLSNRRREREKAKRHTKIHVRDVFEIMAIRTLGVVQDPRTGFSTLVYDAGGYSFDSSRLPSNKKPRAVGKFKRQPVPLEFNKNCYCIRRKCFGIKSYCFTAYFWGFIVDYDDFFKVVLQELLHIYERFLQSKSLPSK